MEPRAGPGKVLYHEACVVLGSATCVGRENRFPTVRNKSLYPPAAGQVWPPHQEISYWRAEQA